jgi:hypothetical protein
VYRLVGNGGRRLGPGFGLLGLPGGYDNHDGWDLVKTSREMAADLEWWDRVIVVCDWGGARRSCIDCGDSDYAVYRWDGNQLRDPDDREDPAEEAWQIEADTPGGLAVDPELPVTVLGLRTPEQRRSPPNLRVHRTRAAIRGTVRPANRAARAASRRATNASRASRSAEPGAGAACRCRQRPCWRSPRTGLRERVGSYRIVFRRRGAESR